MAKSASFHEQLIEKLRKLLRSRQFVPGAKFLTEREIAERFDTSRPTANKALSSLVSTGLLEFRHGAGTFVRGSVLDYDLQHLVSFTEKAKAAGKKPGTQVIALQKLSAAEAPAAAQALKAASSEPLFYLERIRLADAQPVIYERRHVTARFCAGMNKAYAKGSLYDFWTTKCGLTISGADESIRAVNASPAQASALGIKPNTACLLVIATGFLEGGVPLWYEETLYRSDAYEFRNQLGGVSGPKPAQGRMR
ncbi:GntR family transcriptional regulator [Prosthecobacter sp.]|uniref:GntR family transcriptional regulator n=1 Tax=Prosthecobacter sp. TaxID=1965333 RepID=UPI0024874084|nr:GntR family transcriptional regulator [Prosthecobacter sp.]MDI1312528.1 GntR family transcriptional regulator [Prosthecobacter sp.]